MDSGFLGAFFFVSNTCWQTWVGPFSTRMCMCPWKLSFRSWSILRLKSLEKWKKIRWPPHKRPTTETPLKEVWKIALIFKLHAILHTTREKKITDNMFKLYCICKYFVRSFVRSFANAVIKNCQRIVNMQMKRDARMSYRIHYKIGYMDEYIRPKLHHVRSFNAFGSIGELIICNQYLLLYN